MPIDSEDRVVAKSGENSAMLVATTTLRLEALKYVQELFADDNPLNDRSGWKLILGRDFEGSMTASDISKFIDDVCDICRRKDEKFKDFDKARVCSLIFTKFKCTLDDRMIGFILKSKTVVEQKVEKAAKRRFFLTRFISWGWRCFKGIYNGFLEMIKIGSTTAA